MLALTFDTRCDTQNTFRSCTICNVSSASGGFTPRLPPGALPLDPAGGLLSHKTLSKIGPPRFKNQVPPGLQIYLRHCVTLIVSSCCPVYHLHQCAAKLVYSFSNYLVHNFGNGQINGRTNGRTDGQMDKWPGRKQVCESGQSKFSTNEQLLEAYIV